MLTDDQLAAIWAKYRDSEYLDVEVIGLLLAEVRTLRAETERHRERANDAQVSWEVHRDLCAQYKLRQELAAAFGTEDPVEAAKVLRRMQAELARYRRGNVHKRERAELEIEEE